MPDLSSEARRWHNSTKPLVPITTYEQHIVRGDQIKILILHPAAKQDALLCCSLDTCSLSWAHFPYEALSYTWGPPVDGWTDGDEQMNLCNRTVTVKSNLADSLRQFRHNNRCRRLWVDALCINQNNDLERAQQVAMMAQIYAKALQVLVWVEKDDEANTGIITAVCCRAFSKRNTRRWLDPGQSAEDRWSNWLREVENELEPIKELLISDSGTQSGGAIGVRGVHDQIISAIASFSQHRYFKRRWVLQKMSNAQRAILYCGAASSA